MDFKSPVYFGLCNWDYALMNTWVVTLTGCGDVSRQYEAISKYIFKLLDEYTRSDNPPWLWTLSRQYILDCAIGIMRL